MSDVSKPTIDGLWSYLNYQFPATIGNVPLKQFCEQLTQLVGENVELRIEADTMRQHHKNAEAVIANLEQDNTRLWQLCSKAMNLHKEIRGMIQSEDVRIQTKDIPNDVAVMGWMKAIDEALSEFDAEAEKRKGSQ